MDDSRLQRHFGMFSDEGNQRVEDIVTDAIRDELSWSEVVDLLSALSADERFAECMDTMVREIVYDTIYAETGYQEDGQPDEQQEWHDFDPDC